ncbi:MULTISPECIES: efflux RND transporter periplasmic adaptor subunit [Sulfurimonas]|uniref:efflux RND transporter periplasmic adaptor subunit n=1 Tax=Sulfurimonas TaxID=202746 RepID=UPI0012654FA0|nr:efflux RND transporter periplasmic adaptor subunit [Sulfurimonas indica]
MKNKILTVLLTFGAVLFANEAVLPTQKATLHSFKKSLALNAKVIQLSNAQQSITSLVSGHLEKYFVKPAEDVKKGDKIALIESIELSRMSAEYIALKKQYASAEKNYESVKKLYEKGMSSMAQLNAELIKKSNIAAQLTTLQSQLETLGIDTQKLHKATSNFILYAHSDGRVAALLKPLHSSVSTDEAVVSIVKNQAYYIKSYLPLEYATKVQAGDKIVVDYAGKKLTSHITQIMPKVDATTQRVIVLSSVDEPTQRLFLGVYLKATLYFAQADSFVAVKKSALSFFQNEWVVFVPSKEDEHGEDEEHHEVPYSLKVVQIIASDENYVGVLGLREGEEYVSDKSYYTKSLLLKSSLGEHGH